MCSAARTGRSDPLPRRLHLAGLAIARLEGDEADPDGHDLCWRVHRVNGLPFDAEVARKHGVVRRAAAPAHDAIDYLFGHEGGVRCRFRIHGDGSVICQAGPGLSDNDLTGLFNEAILRVVLRQRGLPSFHAAALAKQDRVIMVMGDKGAGKSTLSAGLSAQGWTPIADDLVRVEDRGRWVAFPGARDGKLLADSSAALGHDIGVLAPRWTEMPARDGPPPKHLLPPRAALDDPLAALPVAAIFALAPRRAEGAVIDARPAAPLTRAQVLLRHATPDPLDPVGLPPLYVRDAIAGLARHVPLLELSLVDALDRATEAAAAVSALADGLLAAPVR